MGELLENGMIRFPVDCWDEERRIVGTFSKDFPPSDPYYAYLILWLPTKDEARARELYAAAHPEQALV